MRKNRTMKRLAAWMLTLLMVLQTVPSLSNGDLSGYSSVTSDSVEGGKYAEVVFLGPDREPVESRQVEIGAAIGDLPEAPWRDSYIFDSWKAGDDSVTGETIAESDMEIVATYRSAYPALSAGYEDDTLSVTISAPEGAFPEGVTASLGSVSLSDAQRSAVFAAMGSTEEQELVVLDAIDISFLDENGNKVQPMGNVSISMNLKDKPAGSVSVVHLKDEEPAPVLRKMSLRKAAPLAKGASVANTASAATDSAAGIQGDVVVQNTTDSEFTFDASSFSVYAVVGDTSAKYVFHYPSAEYSFGNELNETTTYQMVAAGGRLYNPGAPTAPSDMDNPQFMGWWTKSGDNWNKQVIPANVDYVTTSAEGLTEGQQTVIDLYARFSGTYYIVYHNETNTDILATETTNTTTGVHLKENGTLRVELILTGPDSTNKAFLGWGKEPGKSLESDVVPEPFDFDASANGTQHLYPVIADAYWITFDKNDWKYTENSKHKGAYDLVNGKYVLNEAGTGAYDRKGSGAEYVAPRFVLQGESYEHRYGSNNVPVTTRPGYRFKGWKYENGTPFDPGFTPTDNICVYADWEAVQTPYTVQYWLQNANGDGYDLVDVDLKLWTGTTDTQTALTAETNLPYTEQDGTQLKLGNKYPHYKIHTSNNPDDPYRIINADILGDESTIINVYYDCITYTLRFIYARSKRNSWNPQYQITEDVSGFTTNTRSKTWDSIVTNAADCGGTWHNVTGKPGVTMKDGYVLGSFNSGDYTYYYVDITNLKYGQEILDVWPYNSLQNVGKNDYQTYKFVSWGVQYDSPYHKSKYNEWNNSHADNKNGLFTIKGSYTKLDDMMINDNDTGVQLENGDVLANVLFGRYKTSNNLYQYQIYVEMLDADNVFSNTRRFTDGKTYKYYRTVENVTSTATLQEQAALAFEGFKLVGGPVDNQNNKTGATNCDVYFYYERERFDLNIFRNHKGDTGAADDDHVTKSIKYGEDISGYLSDENINPFADYVIGETKYTADDGEEFVFTGWYTVAEYVEDENLAQVDLTGKTMKGHLFIYAGWRPVRYRAWVQPNGGELSTSESTWFNLNYGEVIGSYEDVTRDYLRDENGEYIYVIYDHEDPRSAGYVKFDEATDEQKAHALRDGNNLIRYEYLKNAYALVGWHEVLDEEFGTYEQYYANGKSNDGTYTVRPPTINESDTLSTGAYVFGTPVTKDIAIRAIWRRAGTIAVEFLPTMQVGEETLTGTVPDAAAAKTGDGEYIISYNDDGTVKEFSAYATKDQWIYPLSDQVYADLSNMQAQMAPVAPKGYYFVGWMTPYGVVVEPNNVFTIYADLARLIDHHAASDTPWYRYTLTAVYAKIKTVSLTYDFNAPESEMVSKKLTNVGDQADNSQVDTSEDNKLGKLMLNHQVTLSTGAGFDRGPGYKLIGWSLTEGSTTADFKLGETADFIDDKDTTLYAVWQPCGYLKVAKHFDIQEYYLDGDAAEAIWNSLDIWVVDSNGNRIKIKKDPDHQYCGIMDDSGSDTLDLNDFQGVHQGHTHQYTYYVWVPIGQYTVYEDEEQANNLLPGYKRETAPYHSQTVTVIQGTFGDTSNIGSGDAQTINNHYRGSDNYAYLRVQKALSEGSPAEASNKTYTFVIRNDSLSDIQNGREVYLGGTNLNEFLVGIDHAAKLTIKPGESPKHNGTTLNDGGLIRILADSTYTIIELDSNTDGVEDPGIENYDWSYSVSGAVELTTANTKDNPANVVITNTYIKNVGTLSVTKITDPASISQVFKFTAQNSDGKYLYLDSETNKYGLRTETYEFTATSNGSAVILDNIPADTYTVAEVLGANNSEVQVTNYNYVGTTYTDSFDNTTDGIVKVTIENTTENPATVQIANTYTRKTASLTVSKTVVVPEGFTIDTNAAFPMKVTLSEALPEDYTVPTGATLSADRKELTFSLKHGKNIVLTTLPVGATYTIAEENVPRGYTPATNNPTGGAIAEGNGNSVTLTNNYSASSITAQIPVTKVLSGPEGAQLPDITAAYTFSLTANDNTTPINANMADITNPSATGGTASFAAITYEKPGTYTYTVTESGEVNGVTNDAEAASGKTATVEIEDKGDGTLAVKANAGVTFTNKWEPVKLIVKKSVTIDETGASNNANKTYSFQVTTELNNKTYYVQSNNTLAETAYTFTGLAISKLNGTDTANAGGITIENLPAGTYTVTEQGTAESGDAQIANYTLNVTNGSATIEKNGEATVTLENAYTRKTASLTVSKTVVVPEGFTIDTNAVFPMKVTLSEALPADYTVPTGATLSTDRKELTFSLKHGKNIVLTTLPVGATYTIAEENVPRGYTPATNNPTGGTIAEGDGNSAALTNNYTPGTITKKIPVTKNLNKTPETVTAPNIKNKFTFSLTAGSNTAAGNISTPMPEDSGTVITNPDSTGGTAEFGEITYSKPGTYTYNVTESGNVIGIVNDDAATTGKEVTVTVTDKGNGELEASVSDLSFTNTYREADVYLRKIVSGNMGDRNAEFNFTVTVTTQSGNVVYHETRKHENGAVKINGHFPVGAKVIIIEEESGQNDYTTTTDVETGSAVVIQRAINPNTTAEFYVNANGNTVTFENNKEVEVDTGVPMESKPYWLLLGLIPLAGLGVMLTARKRRRDEA